MRIGLIILVMLVGGQAGFLLAARAQTAPAVPTLEREARAALAEENWDAAIASLASIVEGDPAYVSAAFEGSAAYWLGRAHANAGQPGRAHTAWKRGLLALDAAGLFDARLADAFVWSTYARTDADASLAAAAFLRLLTSMDEYGVDAVWRVMRVHLLGIALVVPLGVRERVGLEGWDGAGPPLLTPDAGRVLAGWWRGRDLSPSTAPNERLQEHLRRVAHAREAFGFGSSGDARAAVYIRLGPPARTTEIRFDRMNFRNKVVDRSLTLSESEFYENEFWHYRHLGSDVQFLFYNKSGQFEHGTVEDLLPPAVATGIGASRRGRSKAKAAIRTLEEVYRQLALYHADYAVRYQDVAAFVSLLDDAEAVDEAQQSVQGADQQIDQGGGSDTGRRLAQASQRQPLDGMAASLPGASHSPDRPELFARHIISRGVSEDAQIGQRRMEATPAVHSNEFDDAEPLPLSVRHARFLDSDGTTRTEVYWGVPPGGLTSSRAQRNRLRRDGSSADDVLMVVTLAQRAADYTDRVLDQRRHHIGDVEGDPHLAIAPTTYTLTGDTALYHIAIQWEQLVLQPGPDGSRLETGPRLKVNAHRLDSLRALDASGRRLEMSDLKPSVVASAGDGAQASLGAGIVYPARAVSRAATLALYFEVYHLTFGADDQAAFTVEYEVARRDRPSGGEAVLTSVAADYASPSRTAREHVLVDLGDYRGTGVVEIIVRVTDAATGESVERAITFELME